MSSELTQERKQELMTALQERLSKIPTPDQVDATAHELSRRAGNIKRIYVYGTGRSEVYEQCAREFPLIAIRERGEIRDALKALEAGNPEPAEVLLAKSIPVLDINGLARIT